MILNEITNRLTPLQRQKLGEVVRFGIVGALATLLQYAIYASCCCGAHRRSP